MRINSPESIRRGRLAHARYGSWDNVRREGRIRANMHVAKTQVRLVSRPTIGEGFTGIQCVVEFLNEEDQRGFYIIRLNSCGVNGENLDNRGHMLNEKTVRKKSLFRKAIYRYELYMRNNSVTEAFALKARAAWDKNKADIEAGRVEVLLTLPTPAEGNDTRGYGQGSVTVQPVSKGTR